MIRPVIVLRPQPGCDVTVAAARALGLDAIAAPLSAIEPVDWTVPDPAAFDAILAGSANAFRCGGAALQRLRALPVHAVGDRTAQAARDAGFGVASSGTGGLQAVLDRVQSPARLLRLAGEERIALKAPPGIEISERMVYRVVPATLTEPAAAALRAGGLALVHSAEAARHFASECDRLAIDRARVAIAALGPRIAGAPGAGWQLVAVADQPTDERLLALAHGLCQ